MFNIPSFFGFRATTEPPAPKILDLFPGAAAAYSLRKLSNAYTGSSIQVRRSDLAVQNIGFNGFGELDTAALLAFTGTGALDNGFVTEWFDQSGNARNATQGLALNQPQIVVNGNLAIDGIQPSINFILDSLSIPSSTSMFNAIHEGTSQCTIFAVTKTTTDATMGLIGNNQSQGFANGFEIRYRPTNQHFGFTYLSGCNSLNANTWQLNQQTLLYSKFNVSSSIANQRFRGGVNGNSDYGNNVATGTPRLGNAIGNLFIGDTGVNLIQPFQGFIQEIILYISDQSSNRNNIESNINTYYEIY